MKVTVTRKDLSDALDIAAGASSVRTALPVLASIRLEAKNGALTLLGCDGEMWADAKCAARIDGEDAVLDGEKTWISNGGIADVYVVFARSGEAPGPRGISAFVVEAGTPICVRFM